MVARLWLGTKKLPFKRTVYNVDGTLNRHGTIDRACDLLVSRGNKKIRPRFYVTNLGHDRFILGYPWFREFQLDINWANGMLRGPIIQMETLLFGTLQQAKGYLKEKRNDKDVIFKAKEILLWPGVTPLETKGGPIEANCTHTAVEMVHKYAQKHEKEEITLPPEFKRHEELFSNKEANKFPPSRGEGDHKIVLLEDAPPCFNCKVYPLSRNEQEIEDKFLDENITKGYITPLDSPYGFSTFMIPKKDSKEKRYIIDYQPLDAVTRKDVTPLPNLAQCIEDLQRMELFSKFDIRWCYILGLVQLSFSFPFLPLSPFFHDHLTWLSHDHRTTISPDSYLGHQCAGIPLSPFLI